MWQYTTETIINTNTGNLLGGVRAQLFKKNGEARTYDASGASYNGLDTFIIDGVTSFMLKYITHITRYAYRAAANAVASLEFTAAPSAAGTLRLTVELKEEGRVSSYMQDAYLRHKKPFHYEIAVTTSDTTATLASRFVALIKKDLAMTDFDYFDVAIDSTNTSKIIFTGKNCHIRFASAPQVVTVGTTAAGSAEKLTGWEDYTVYTGASSSITTVGDCGAGTVEHLIKDLRIPTNATINPFAPDNGGRPIPGGQYDQILVEYETPRRHVASGVMGSVGEVSRTSHVFFIEKNQAPAIINWFASFAASTNFSIIDEIDAVGSESDGDNVTKGTVTPESARNHPGSVQ